MPTGPIVHASTAAAVTAASPGLARGTGGADVIALVGTAHFVSHFYMLVLPPLFPLMREVYGVGYTFAEE